MPWRPLLEICREVERLSVRLNPAATKELKLFFANRLGLAVGQISDDDLSKVIKSTTLKNLEGVMVHAAREMKWLASGRRSADGNREVIHPDRWAFLTLDIEHQAVRDLNGNVVYADLKGAFGNDLTEKEWQEVELGLTPPTPTTRVGHEPKEAVEIAAPEESEDEPAPPRKKPTIKPRRRGGRKKGSGSLAADDAPLLELMKPLIAGGKAHWAAAMEVVGKAAGTSTDESKAKRLVKRFKEWEKTTQFN